ncbi:MAG: portal protein [Patescibacteria group bacterium]
MNKQKEKIVEEAHKRFKTLTEDSSEIANRESFIRDLKFANGNSNNNWQWDDDYNSQNNSNNKSSLPRVTVNKVRVHNRAIANDIRQNKPQIKVLATGDGANKRTAEIIEGWIRHIQKISNSDIAFDTAADFAIDAGLGYIKVTTKYVDETSNKQTPIIKWVPDPMSIYMDMGKEFNAEDSMYAFEEEMMSKEDFEAKYPESETKSDSWDFRTVENGWRTKDEIRVVNYYKVIVKPETIYYLPDGQSVKKSELPLEALDMVKQNPDIKKRSVDTKTVKCYKIAGDEIIEEYDWLDSTIPIVPVKGNEKIIDGKTVRSGNTTFMRDSQRMFNYELANEIEFKYLQNKSPYMAPHAAIKGLEMFWDNLHESSYGYIPYNHIDNLGNAIPAPQRQQPPASSTAYYDGMRIASENIQETSGQFDAQMGQNVNQQSGVALQAVQNRGQISTFQFPDNLARAMERVGNILIKLMPQYIDAEEMIRILGEDGKESEVSVDVTQEEAFSKKMDMLTGEINEVFNPGVGTYSIDVQVGPSYGTKRQEAFNALTEIAARTPGFMERAGDIYFKIADFPMADKIAKRFLPQGVQDDEMPEQPQIPPEIQQQMQQHEQTIQQLDATIQAMSADLDKTKIEYAKLEIDRYKAETERLKVQLDHQRETAIQENENIKAEIDDIINTEFASEQQQPEQAQMQPDQGMMQEQPQGDMMQQPPIGAQNDMG